MKKILLFIFIGLIFSSSAVKIHGDTIPFQNGIVIALEPGMFEKETATSMTEFNESGDWKILVQKSIFFLGFDIINYTTVSVKTPWETMSYEDMVDRDLFTRFEILEDPWNKTGNIIWIRFVDNGTQEVDLENADNIDKDRYHILRANEFYRIVLQYEYNWEAKYQPEEFIIAYDQFVLTPQDDGKIHKEIYEKYDFLNTDRSLPGSPTPDSDLVFTVEINNSNYWKNIDCLEHELTLGCEPLIRSMVNLPYAHGEWRNSYNIFNRYSELDKVFKYSGSVEIGLGIEYFVNRSSDTGIFDVFLDNIFMIYNKEGKAIDPMIIDELKNEYVYNTKSELIATSKVLNPMILGFGLIALVYITKKKRNVI